MRLNPSANASSRRRSVKSERAADPRAQAEEVESLSGITVDIGPLTVGRAAVPWIVLRPS